jgi:hypothetical protein
LDTGQRALQVSLTLSVLRRLQRQLRGVESGRGYVADGSTCGIAIADCIATKQAYKLNAAMLAAHVTVQTPA